MGSGATWEEAVLISAGVLVSACCHAVIMLDGDDEHYQCTRCMKPCDADGTLGEYFAGLKESGDETV